MKALRSRILSIALAASLLDMRLKNALPAILMGVIVAGIIVMLLTFGVISVGSLA